MQYGAPGTEFNVYADGVYVADYPMGPYTYQSIIRCPTSRVVI